MVLAYAWLELCCEVTGTYAHAWLKVASIAKRRSFLGAALLIMRPASRDQQAPQFRPVSDLGDGTAEVRQLTALWSQTPAGEANFQLVDGKTQGRPATHPEGCRASPAGR